MSILTDSNKEVTRMINADTTIYTTHADFAGYTWLDGILGDQSPAVYARTCKGNHESDAEAVASLCGWLEEMIGQGFWLSEEDYSKSLESGEYSNSMVHETLVTFTPASAHAEILELAEQEEALS